VANFFGSFKQYWRSFELFVMKVCNQKLGRLVFAKSIQSDPRSIDGIYKGLAFEMILQMHQRHMYLCTQESCSWFGKGSKCKIGR
jgi:hypothetical protein